MNSIKLTQMTPRYPTPVNPLFGPKKGGETGSTTIQKLCFDHLHIGLNRLHSIGEQKDLVEPAQLDLCSTQIEFALGRHDLGWAGSARFSRKKGELSRLDSVCQKENQVAMGWLANPVFKTGRIKIRIELSQSGFSKLLNLITGKYFRIERLDTNDLNIFDWFQLRLNSIFGRNYSTSITNFVSVLFFRCFHSRFGPFFWSGSECIFPIPFLAIFPSLWNVDFASCHHNQCLERIHKIPNQYTEFSKKSNLTFFEGGEGKLNHS